MLKFTFCPTFTIKSFVFFIAIVNIIMYIVSLVWTFTDYQLNQSYFMGPNLFVLKKLGMKIPYFMRYDYEVWRFVTPLFLTFSLLNTLVSFLYS